MNNSDFDLDLDLDIRNSHSGMASETGSDDANSIAIPVTIGVSIYFGCLPSRKCF